MKGCTWSKKQCEWKEKERERVARDNKEWNVGTAELQKLRKPKP